MSAERITFLINNLQEGLDVEVKNWLGGLSTNHDKAKLAREIIALANNGGGFVFIGFNDEGEEHPELPPEEGQLEAYTQDSISSLVQRYVQPPCQCAVGLYSREGSAIQHPVITVPGRHRTPLFAARSSPDQRTLITGAVYIRRPGGLSEQARNQDDWEKLLERLVKARQTEQLEAIREIINPTNVITPPTEGLTEWIQASLEQWRSLVDPLQAGDPRKLESGYWYIGFEINPFPETTLGDLHQFVERDVRRYSGWPPFTYIHREPLRPNAHGDIIQAWLAEPHDADVLANEAEHADFWRVSKQGKGFLLRPMQEDRPDYVGNIHPRPEGPFFDWTLPVYRAIEILKYIQGMATRFSDENAEFRLVLHYEHTNGRKLQQHSLRYMLMEGAACTSPSIESSISGSIYEIENNLEETVLKLLTPVFEQFQFTQLPRALVNNVTRETLAYR